MLDKMPLVDPHATALKQDKQLTAQLKWLELKKKEENMSKKGDRVEMLDGSMQGTIAQVINPFYWIIEWDDGEKGHVHPNDVKHLV